jgi:hypothetical protein
MEVIKKLLTSGNIIATEAGIELNTEYTRAEMTEMIRSNWNTDFWGKSQVTSRDWDNFISETFGEGSDCGPTADEWSPFGSEGFDFLTLDAYIKIDRIDDCDAGTFADNFKNQLMDYQSKICAWVAGRPEIISSDVRVLGFDPFEYRIMFAVSVEIDLCVYFEGGE